MHFALNTTFSSSSDFRNRLKCSLASCDGGVMPVRPGGHCRRDYHDQWSAGESLPFGPGLTQTELSSRRRVARWLVRLRLPAADRRRARRWATVNRLRDCDKVELSATESCCRARTARSGRSGSDSPQAPCPAVALATSCSSDSESQSERRRSPGLSQASSGLRLARGAGQ
jgi:hypothetical protein